MIILLLDEFILLGLNIIKDFKETDPAEISFSEHGHDRVEIPSYIAKCQSPCVLEVAISFVTLLLGFVNADRASRIGKFQIEFIVDEDV